MNSVITEDKILENFISKKTKEYAINLRRLLKTLTQDNKTEPVYDYFRVKLNDEYNTYKTNYPLNTEGISVGGKKPRKKTNKRKKNKKRQTKHNTLL